MALDTVVQKLGSILINKVDTLSKNVKATIEIIIAIIILQVLEPCSPDRLPEKITGNTGNTQGARTLNMPDRNDMIIRIIHATIEVNNHTMYISNYTINSIQSNLCNANHLAICKN